MLSTKTRESVSAWNTKEHKKASQALQLPHESVLNLSESHKLYSKMTKNEIRYYAYTKQCLRPRRLNPNITIIHIFLNSYGMIFHLYVAKFSKQALNAFKESHSGEDTYKNILQVSIHRYWKKVSLAGSDKIL